MLGEVLKDMSRALRKCVTGQIDKNLMEMNGKDLEQELLKLVPGPTRA